MTQFAKEAPNKVTHQKPREGWWSWWAAEGDPDHNDDDDEGEVIVYRPSNLPEWLKQLTPDERSNLFKSIGYDENQNIEPQPQVSLL